MDPVKPDTDKEAWELQCYGCTEAELEELIKRVYPLDHAMIAVSMLSDAQHELLVGLREEARQTINRVKWVIRNWCRMQEEELLGLFEVAELAGVTPSAVANWRKRAGDFPAPVATLKSGPVFRLSQIRAWLRTRRVPMATVIATINLKQPG